MPHFFPFQKREVEIIFKASCGEALSLLKTQKFSSILVQNTAGDDSLEFLVQARLYQPMAPRLLIAEDLSESEVREGINKAQVYRFMRWPLSEREIWAQLESALQKHSMYLSRSLLLRESSHQNKQLEALTHSLEAMVEERTQYIELSHHEESEKLNRERQLVRFIKDLATQTSFEDILGILRKELRKFHKMGDPILAYRLGGNKTFFLSFQLGHFTQTESLTPYEFPKTPQVPSAELIRYFANHFGRPFIKAYVVPLELRLTSHFVGGEGEAVLCIENSLSDKEMGPFIDFMSDRMRPLSMALDRVLLESQLSSFSYRWEKTFDGMRDPIAIVDVDYNVVRANRKFSDRFLQHKCYESFAHRKSQCEGCPVPQAMKEGHPQAGQIQVDGRIYQVHSYPVLLDQGTRPTNVVNQYVDITQSRELYLRMLQNEKMGAIGMLAGNIAHELNNPLTGLRALTQVLLQEAPQEGNLHADLVEIEKATARSQRIIKNLLDFSKGEDQPSEYISVDEIIERTLPMLKSALRTHRLEVDLQTLGQTVFVEPHLLQQVVFNLINNACQAMKDPGRLKVTTRSEGKFVITEIEDTGPGIPLEIQRRIFEPFFTTKKEGHGTGLGLSMSKSIIEKFGGTIQFHNVEPHGSCFTIELPRKDSE
ncbi:two-component sensor histidine kinase [Bdellovibrio bacteriovorus]|uniref:histidine kinase n=2 Tax=Bdellovibrio bacteriovorus TaxID=959 RepID=A0A162H5W7_BDEBC|nr:two-component sensor histidine kinase [Bdellovibrio bacteriovorus]